MKKIIKKLGIVLVILPALMLGLGFAGIITAPAYAAEGEACTGQNADGTDFNGVENAAGECETCDVTKGLSGAMRAGCASGEGQQTGALFGNGSIVNNVINIMLFIVGILCVVMIIFGGIRYVTSTGDKNRVDNAKNTILYAVVGLIVAIVAFALVNWVFTSIGQS